MSSYAYKFENQRIQFFLWTHFIRHTKNRKCLYVVKIISENSIRVQEWNDGKHPVLFNERGYPGYHNCSFSNMSYILQFNSPDPFSFCVFHHRGPFWTTWMSPYVLCLLIWMWKWGALAGNWRKEEKKVPVLIPHLIHSVCRSLGLAGCVSLSPGPSF